MLIFERLIPSEYLLTDVMVLTSVTFAYQLSLSWPPSCNCMVVMLTVISVQMGGIGKVSTCTLGGAVMVLI